MSQKLRLKNTRETGNYFLEEIIFAKGYVLNWSEQVFVIEKV